MTRPDITGQDTPFIRWVRNHPELDSVAAGLDRQDIDLVIHIFNRYRQGTLLFLEVKTRGASPTAAQRDTQGIVNQMMKQKAEVNTLRGRREYHFYGYHLLVFSDTCPTDSENIWWDGIKINERELVNLLLMKLTSSHLRARRGSPQRKGVYA